MRHNETSRRPDMMTGYTKSLSRGRGTRFFRRRVHDETIKRVRYRSDLRPSDRHSPRTEKRRPRRGRYLTFPFDRPLSRRHDRFRLGVLTFCASVSRTFPPHGTPIPRHSLIHTCIYISLSYQHQRSRRRCTRSSIIAAHPGWQTPF